MTGEISRSSDPRPDVANHQISTMTPIAATPTRRRVIGGGAARMSSSDGCESVGIYLVAGAASAG